MDPTTQTTLLSKLPDEYKELSIILSVSESSVKSWTATQRENLEKERNRKIGELYLRAWNTQESIADLMGLTQPGIKKIVENITFDTIAESYKTFTPPLYNIWNLQKQEIPTTTAHRW
jgi:hypothetical protein